MAARAGAVIADAEFVQFHPTAIAVGRDPAPLATEALRGEGATLIDETGRRFMPAVHADAELAPRDVVARAHPSRDRRAAITSSSIAARRSARNSPRVSRPSMPPAAQPASIRRRQPIPVAPAAHYHMGGIATDARRPHLAGRSVGGRRMRLHRPARRQPAGIQLAARSAGVRRARRRRHARPRYAPRRHAARRPRPALRLAAAAAVLRETMTTARRPGARRATDLPPRLDTIAASRARRRARAGAAQHDGDGQAGRRRRAGPARKPRRPFPHRLSADGDGAARAPS